MENLHIQDAAREQVKIKMSIASPTGFGKTYSSLLLAYGLTGDWNKIGLIDTENRSASLYSDLGKFQVINLTPPFSVERYIQAIKMFEQVGKEVIIIDSVTHVWKSEGGVLEFQNKLGGRFQDWLKANPVYQSLVNAILQSPCHVICSIRKKMSYEITDDKKVKKIGLEDEIRDGFAYDMTIGFELINDKHMCYTSKDRTRMFEGKPEFIITPATGELIRKWCDEGVDVEKERKDELAKVLKAIPKCKDVAALTALKQAQPSYIVSDASFIEAGKKRYEVIMAEAPKEAVQQ